MQSPYEDDSCGVSWPLQRGDVRPIGQTDVDSARVDIHGHWTIRRKERQEMAMDSCTSIRVGRVEIFQKFRWISLTGVFVVFDWLKMNFIPSASLHLWIYSFV
jgi:hypothetical protein